MDSPQTSANALADFHYQQMKLDELDAKTRLYLAGRLVQSVLEEWPDEPKTEDAKPVLP